MKDGILEQKDGTLDIKGRCCGRGPIPYKQEGQILLFCPLCYRGFNPETKKQESNWAWMKERQGNWVRRCHGCGNPGKKSSRVGVFDGVLCDRCYANFLKRPRCNLVMALTEEHNNNERARK